MIETDNDIVECLECSKPISVEHPEVNKEIVCEHCGQKFRIRLCWMLQGIY